MADTTGPLGIPTDLWDVLACPCPQHAPVAPDEAMQRVLCTVCRTSFEVRDGIPVMLLDEAVPGPAGVGIPVDGPAGG